jgi:hypothetical protein
MYNTIMSVSASINSTPIEWTKPLVGILLLALTTNLFPNNIQTTNISVFPQNILQQIKTEGSEKQNERKERATATNNEIQFFYEERIFSNVDP